MREWRRVEEDSKEEEGRAGAGGLGVNSLLYFPSCDFGIIVRTFQSHPGHLGHMIREYKRA